MQHRKVNGMDCPVCDSFIPIDIRKLLFAGAITCPHCNLQLTVNRPQSQAAMTALSKMDKALRQVEKASSFKR